MRNIALLSLVLTMAHTLPVFGQMIWGRPDEQLGAVTLSLRAGTIYQLDAEVRETTRPLEELGLHSSGSPPENYSWKELGLDDNAVSFGFSAQKYWRFVTLSLGAVYANPEGGGKADRNFYLGVGEVNASGQTYEYMAIPEGRSYDIDIKSYVLDARLMFTPVTFGSTNALSVIPWVHIGAFGFIGDYVIDAGPVRGVTQYENPPRDYVIGGRASGSSSIVVPELGAGVEVRLTLSRTTKLLLAGHAAFLTYDGKAGDFGISSRNEKDIDIDYRTIGGKVMLEMVMNPYVDLIVGIEFNHWTGDGEIRATSKSIEEVAALREKFDKDVSFEASSLMGVVGIRF